MALIRWVFQFSGFAHVQLHKYALVIHIVCCSAPDFMLSIIQQPITGMIMSLLTAFNNTFHLDRVLYLKVFCKCIYANDKHLFKPVFYKKNLKVELHYLLLQCRLSRCGIHPLVQMKRANWQHNVVGRKCMSCDLLILLSCCSPRKGLIIK